MVTPINSSGILVLQNSFTQNLLAANRSAERLSSGLAINRGSDNPAGLISSEQLRAVLAALDAETRVLARQDNIASTAEAALSEVSSTLIDTKALQVQMADSTLSDDERAAIQLQIDSNIQAVDRMAASAGFNGISLFSGDTSLSYGDASVDLPSISSYTLGETEIDGTTYTLSNVISGGGLEGDASSGSLVISAAIMEIANLRGSIGAYQRSAIESGIAVTQVAIENTAAAESLIRDTDYASEAVDYSRSELLTRANLQAFAMVNSSNATVLDLLG